MIAKLFITKPRIESKWYHENPQFNIVFSDVSSVESKYVKAALFCLKPTPVAVAAPAPVTNSNNRDSFFVDNTPAPTKRDDNMYSVDIASSDVPRTQLEVMYCTVELHSFDNLVILNC